MKIYILKQTEHEQTWGQIPAYLCPTEASQAETLISQTADEEIKTSLEPTVKLEL